jgi:hypothetical protein
LLQLQIVVDIPKLSKILQQTIEYLRNMEIFHTEAAQLSRFIFMNCKQYRMMKGMHEMKKSHQALLRYLNLDLAGSMENYKGFIDDNDGEMTVPYRQSLDYILIRLQGLSKILIRFVECSKKATRFFLGLIKAGSFYMKGLIFISTLASVWSRCREFCKFTVEQYNKLRSFRESLKEKPGTKWIEQGYELPEVLETWIGDDYLRLIVNETYDIKLLLKQEDIQQFISTKGEVDKAFQNVKIEDNEMEIEEKMLVNELEIEDFTPLPRNIKEKTKTEVLLDHSLASFLSKDSVLTFIKNESHFRKVDPKKSLSINKMKKKEWKEFREGIKTKSVLMQEGAFINFVRDYLEEYEIK